MLKLINIIKTENTIEADYIPESSTKSAHISLHIVTKKYIAEEIDDYGKTYCRMAANGLIRTLEELESGTRKELPKERLVMWY